MGVFMNIYKISQTENNRYDTYDSAIVYANTEEEARNIHPDGNVCWGDYRKRWVNSPDKVTVEKIGETNLEVKSGVILASFNAG
jgi:hypothetical protein